MRVTFGLKSRHPWAHRLRGPMTAVFGTGNCKLNRSLLGLGNAPDKSDDFFSTRGSHGQEYPHQTSKKDDNEDD
jgi:hypothetical protein